jgi:hypothetical protein
LRGNLPYLTGSFDAAHSQHVNIQHGDLWLIFLYSLKR